MIEKDIAAAHMQAADVGINVKAWRITEIILNWFNVQLYPPFHIEYVG